MRIYAMTATFGKLENQTLTLKPGLNVIHAPNEWGKSTWCAFLTAMLYGFEARTRSTQTALSDREHYTPWSGAPMAGRIDLNWNGRDITIERRSKGRSVFGDFKAYETASGLPVPELNAANCGQTLLGVEKSVFTRSAFIRLTDMPVTQDESLRRRLNALVTTGDESSAGDRLEAKLRELRNRCRYNRTGLLPQLEAEAAGLRQKLRELKALESQSQSLRQQQSRLEQQLDALENHRAALAYRKSLSDARQVAQARQDRDRAARQLEAAEAACAGSMPREEARRAVRELNNLRQQQAQLQSEFYALRPPQPPEVPGVFRGMDPAEALDKARTDAQAYAALKKADPLPWLPLLLLALAWAAGVLLWLPGYWYLSLAGLAGAGILASLWGVSTARRRKEAEAISARYGFGTPDDWLKAAKDYVNQSGSYHHSASALQAHRDMLEDQLRALDGRIARLCGSQSAQDCLTQWQRAADDWDALDAAQRELRQAERHVQALAAIVRQVPAPTAPDALTLDEAETARQITDATACLRQLQRNLGQFQGQMAAIGHRSDLEKRLNALRQRIDQLEDTYAALTLSLETLEKARAELQRRFAPKIAGRAQTLIRRLTGGRYDRLVLTEDLSLEATARDEGTLRTTLWRSDGTVDQLYLALRLAVADALTPEAPLILDDALVRFDDDRLKAAMEVLKEESAARQVILFTCQSREQQYL